MNNFVKPLSLLSLTFLLLIGSFLPIFGKKVYAGPADLVSQLQREARLFTVTNAIVNCIYDKKGTGLVDYLETEDLASSVPLFSSADALVGTHVKPSDGTSNCSDGNWVADAIDMLGFESHTDFMNIFYEKASNTNIWELKTNYSLDADGNAIKDFLNASSINGNSAILCVAKGGCSVKPLSDAARYELMLTNFARGCGARLVTGGEDEIKTIAPNQIATIKEVDETGTIKENIYKLDKELQTTVVVGSGVTNDGRYRCETIIKQIEEYAPAFAEKVKQATTDEQPVGDLKDALTPPVIDAKTICEKSTGLLTGWIVCDGMELLSSGMDKIMNQVDSMLNVDIKQMETANDNGLQKAWGSFRAIASFMLLGIAIVMILSQAMGGGS